MLQLIDYQKEGRGKTGGPACFEWSGFEEFCLTSVLLALPLATKKGRISRRASPKAPPSPPYRGVTPHTDRDFLRNKPANGAFLRSPARGRGKNDMADLQQGERG